MNFEIFVNLICHQQLISKIEDIKEIHLSFQIKTNFIIPKDSIYAY